MGKRTRLYLNNSGFFFVSSRLTNKKNVEKMNIFQQTKRIKTPTTETTGTRNITVLFAHYKFQFTHSHVTESFQKKFLLTSEMKNGLK